MADFLSALKPSSESRVGRFSKKFSKSSANEFGDTYGYPKLPQKIVAHWLAHSAPDQWSKFYYYA